MTNSTLEKNIKITLYQMDGLPFFLEKNIIKEDILHWSFPKHYYFDIINGEFGDITLDFKKGRGIIYASVQQRNITMEQPNWRGQYRLPINKNESLRHNIFKNKILIKESDTDNCINGCYVLITILRDMEYSNNINNY